ncbi:MAG: hypothetical protein ACI9MB_001847, partial [Verrucomicrobiales bacterium]
QQDGEAGQQADQSLSEHRCIDELWSSLCLVS